MNKTLATLLTVLLTAIIVGGGVYFWQQSQIESLQNEIEDLKEDIVSIGNNEAEEAANLEGDYVNEEYGFTLDLIGDYEVFEDYDEPSVGEQLARIFVGPDSSYGPSGFFINIVSESVSEAYKNSLTDAQQGDCLDSEVESGKCDFIFVEESELTLGGLSTKMIRYGTAIGYSVDEYFFEHNDNTFVIWVVASNDDAHDIIETIQFAQ